MRVTPFALALLLAAPAFARGPQQQVVEHLNEQLAKRAAQMTAPNGCPVGFSANRKGSAGLKVTKPGDSHSGMGLDLGFNATARAIVEAGITVHGMPLGPHVIGVPISAPTEATEDFVLKGTADQPVTLSAIWMTKLGTVSWVELTRVVFSDGGEWAPTERSQCVARPSMVVLVDSPAR